MDNKVFGETYIKIFKKLPEAVVVYEAVDGGNNFIIKYFNGSAEKIEKIKASKVIGKKITEAFPSAKKFGIFQVLYKVWKTGKARIFPLAFYKDKRISGWRDNHIFKLPSGEVVAIYFDRTKEKQKEEEAQIEKKFLKNIFDLNPYGIQIYDKNGHHLTANKAYLKLFKKAPPSEYNFFEDPVAAKAGFHEKNLQVKKGKSYRAHEMWYNPHWVNSRYPDKLLCFRSVVFPIMDSENKFDRAVVMFEDVTKQKMAEQSLQQSQTKLSITLKSIGDAVIVTDVSGKVSFLNSVAQKLTGWTEKNAVNRSLDSFFNIFNEKTGKRVTNPVSKVIQSGKIVGLGNHTVLISREGKKISIEDSAAPIKDENGKIVGVVLVFHDVTEKREVEKQLVLSEERYRALVEESPESITILDASGKIIFLNKRSAARFGLPAKKLIGRSIWDFIPASKSAFTARDLKEVVRTNKARSIESSVTIGGVNKYYKIILTPISGGGNKAAHIMVISVDISDLKKYELELKESEKNYSGLFNNAADAIFIADIATRKFINCNKAAEKLLGYSLAQIVSMKAEDIHPKDLVKETVKEFKKQARGKTKPFSSEILTKNKKRIPVSIKSSVVYIQNKPYLQGVFRDITEQRSAEYKLREGEERYRNLISSLPKTEYVMVHRGGKLLWVNDNVLSFLGYSRKKMIGTSVFDYLEIEYQKIVLRNIMKREVGKKVSEYEIKIRNKKGQMRDVLVRGSAINYEGQPAVLLVISDITDRKLSENKIIESESKYRSLFDLSNDAIFLMKGNIFIECNKKTLEMFGCRRDQIIGKPPFNFSPKKQPDGRSSLVSANEKIKIALSGKPQFFEWRHSRLNGEEFDTEVSLNNIKISEEEYLLASVRDISERKRAERLILEDEEKLRESNSDLIKFKLAADNASDDIIITDPKGVILYANPALEINSGYSLSEIIGKTPAIWGGQMSEEFYKNFWNTVLKEKDPFIGEMKNKRKNGELYISEMRVSPILNSENEVEFFVGISRDITKVKELDRAKSEFVSVASHQLKTPISGIKWMLESILQNRENNLNQKQIEWLKNVYDNNERMIKLVNDLLNISRIDSGKYAVLNLNKVEIAPLVERAIKNLGSFVAERKVMIEYKNNLPAGYSLNLDEDKIYQVISNLISNSIKYSKLEGGRSEIITKIKNKEFVLSVKDNGVGIPIQNQRHIFEKFFRADNASISHASGSGLGLYIAKYFVENHKGKIWFESKEGVGTTFSFTISSNLI